MSQAGSLGEEVGERPTHSRYGLNQNGLRGSEVQTHMPGSASSEDVARTERDVGVVERPAGAPRATSHLIDHRQDHPVRTRCAKRSSDQHFFSGAAGNRTRASTRDFAFWAAVSLRLGPVRSRSLPAVSFSGLDAVKSGHLPPRAAGFIRRAVVT
jgi:hypothetical protein